MEDVAVSPANPGLVLAGVVMADGSPFGTLYRSTNGGASWSEVIAFAGTAVHDIEFAPTGVIYLATAHSVWTSDDEGVTFTQFDMKLGTFDHVFEVTLDPTDPLTLWAGVLGQSGIQDKNVMVTHDGGLKWRDVTPPLSSPLTCTGIALDPGDTERVFVTFGVAAGDGVWFSDDGGGHWFDRSAGLPGSPMADIVHDGTRLLLAGGQNFLSQFAGLYSSMDDGVTWTALHDASWPSLVISDIELDSVSGSTIYLASRGAGVYRSTDAGATWSFGIGGTAGLTVNEVCMSPSGGPEVLCGSSSVAVWKSLDGIDFAPSSQGINWLDTSSIAFNPNSCDEIAVSFEGWNDGGVYTSTDGGLTWTLEALPPTRYNTVGFAPDGTLYALSDGPSTVAPEGLYCREAGGWVGLGPDQGPLFESELFALTFSSIDPALIVLGGKDFGVAGSEGTVWVSRDRGSSWVKAYEGLTAADHVRRIVILADGTDQRMVGAFNNNGIMPGGALRSIDGGNTWTLSSTGLAPDVQCHSLAASHFDPNTLYLADDDYPDGGVYRSIDGGQTWTSTGFVGRAHSVATDPNNPNVVFVASFTGAKFQFSVNRGATFFPLDGGLEAAGHGNDLVPVLDPACRNQILLATRRGCYGLR